MAAASAQTKRAGSIPPALYKIFLKYPKNTFNTKAPKAHEGIIFYR
jgi:hypothetical protein